MCQVHFQTIPETNMTTTLSELKEWVDSVAARTQPDNIHWCDGGEAENRSLFCLHQQPGRRRTEQQLDGAGRRTREN
jgi:GTP-dependent phosphoenolpyruvate carboxykinase